MKHGSLKPMKTLKKKWYMGKRRDLANDLDRHHSGHSKGGIPKQLVGEPPVQ
jgi:hypothetical protein